jgi:Tol biopolymer transport system component
MAGPERNTMIEEKPWERFIGFPDRASAVAAAFACVTLLSCVSDTAGATRESLLFADPQRVSIAGYDGHAMEPFLTRDGRYLLFNNLNDPSVNTNLHFAERIDDLKFRYRGELSGVNTTALEGVATADQRGTFYFVSTRSYEQSLSTIYRGKFADGRVTGVELVPGISRRKPGIVNFDVEVSHDGASLYFVDARFGKKGPETADIVIARQTASGFERLPDSAKLMKNVNTRTLEYAPCISADGLTLLFTRLIPGPPPNTQIFVTQRERTTERFGPAARLTALSGFVEAPTLSPDERTIYFHKRDGTQFVIYRATRRSVK